MPAKPETLRHKIGAKVRELRLRRRWTQARLAELLGISQNYLSVLERGQGSFTAEQLLTLLRHFNIPIDEFSPEKQSVGSQIQNALARQGADHLLESTSVLPSEHLNNAFNTIRETLLSAESARYITALAPVIAANARNINFAKLRAELAQAGVDRRLPWLLENVKEALDNESRRPDLPRDPGLAYDKARIALHEVLAAWASISASLNRNTPPPDDLFDPDIATEKSLQEVRRARSRISKRWHILSRLQADDFADALRAANE
jgi:transcriptional regulator with XRE-family HTH domain